MESIFVSEMVNFLGGIVINDLNDINNATHIIYNNYFSAGENNINNAIIKESKNIFHVDIKWIFDCFFKFKKCDEKEDEYKI